MSYRIVDRSGFLAESFPEALPEEIGLEGKRIHLKTVWTLICEIHRAPGPGAAEYESFELVDAEPVDAIASRNGELAGIAARLRDATPELQAALEEILACFAHETPERTIPLEFEVSDGLFRKGPLKRLAGRFVNARVVPSALLARALARLPGIEEVRAIPSQEALFNP
jgi:hypothetical protein